jgi:hypothetical protein
MGLGAFGSINRPLLAELGSLAVQRSEAQKLRCTQAGDGAGFLIEDLPGRGKLPQNPI